MLTTLVRALMTLVSFSSLRRGSPEWAAAQPPARSEGYAIHPSSRALSLASLNRPRNGLAFGLSNKALVSIPAQGD